MDDTISRKAAIDAVTDELDMIDHVPQWVFDRLEKRLKQLPSTQPERKTGKWIIRDNPGTGWYRVTCSECGEDVTSEMPMIGFFPNAKALWDYCPYCGADLRGEHDG